MKKSSIVVASAALSLLLVPYTARSVGAADSSVVSSPAAQSAPAEAAPADAAQSDKSSHEIQKDAAKEQLSNSPPADAQVAPPMPRSGKILYTPKQKQAVAEEAVKIDGDDPAPVIPAVVDGRATIALALGGGGARGAAHIGVIKAFRDNNIPIDYVVGNSMGAIVGGLYCAGVPLDQISSMLEDGSLRHAYMPGPLPPKVLVSPLAKLVHIGAPDHYAGLFSGKKFTKYIEAHLPQANMNLQDTKIPFCAVATNLLDGKAYRISEGRISTAMKASSAITPLIQPVAMKDKVFVDGGVRANLPVSAARRTGAGMVVAVLVDEPLTKVPAKRFMHLQWIASRMADIVLAIADERQLQFADMVVNPNVSGIPILSKNAADVKKAEDAGYQAALKAIPEIRKRMSEPPHAHSSVAAGASNSTQ